MAKVKSSIQSKNLNKGKKSLDIKKKSKALSFKKQPGRSQRGRKFQREKKQEPPGVVYLSHIPHGFYEEQIEAYFNQFGKVTAVSLPRSKSGRAKGFAFIEYKYPEVAKIAAETMNNYLMFNRLLKAKYIPPEQQKPRLFQIAKAARDNHNTVADRAELAIKHNRKLKNRHLKLGLEVKLAAKLLKKKNSLMKRARQIGLSDELTMVDEANSKSILARKNEIKALRNAKKDKLNLNSENLTEENSSGEESSSGSGADDLLTPGENDCLSEESGEEDVMVESEEDDYKKVISFAKNAKREILKKTPKLKKYGKPNKSLVSSPVLLEPEITPTPKKRKIVEDKNQHTTDKLELSNVSKKMRKRNSKVKSPKAVDIYKTITPEIKNKNVSPLTTKTPLSGRKTKNSTKKLSMS